MITKADVLNSMRDEIKIIKHLGTKVKAEHLGYQPSANQRTLLQLLQYLSYCGLGSAVFIVTGTRDHAKQMTEDSLKVNLNNFSEAMDNQMVKIEDSLKGLDDKSLSEKEFTMPTGDKVKAGYALVNRSLKFLVAYRMQLFLYLKDAGVTGLGSSNCWSGVDAPVAKA
jgi:hypothetical protein